MRFSLVELKRLNIELKKQNEDKDQELERMSKALDDLIGSDNVADAHKKISALEERIKDVRHYYVNCNRIIIGSQCVYIWHR